MGENRNAYNIFIEKSEGKRPFGRPRHRWGNSIRIDFRGMGGEEWSGCIWLRIGTSNGLL
jgi:hypothetical protein